MPSALSSLGATMLLFGIVAVVYCLWIEEAEDTKQLQSARRFAAWAARGLVLPLSVWFLLNTGWLPSLPPLLPPDPSAVPGTAAWVQSLPARLAGSTVLAASVWGAFSLGWLLSSQPAGLWTKPEARRAALFWTVVSLLPATVLVAGIGPAALGVALMLPSAAALTGVRTFIAIPPARPTWSQTEAHLKFGRNTEAEQSILAELEKHPDDYDGWLMLAELYARQFHDLDLADQTVRDLCTQPNVNAAQVTLALHRLADWHLELGEDPVAARRALETLAAQFPGSHFAHMAQQRLRQLPISRAALRDQKARRPLRLPTLKDPLDDAGPATPTASPGPALVRAAQLVDRLTAEPNAIPPREELAHLLAEDLGNLGQAIEQIELLLGFPDRPPEKTPAWLAAAAAWHLRLGRNPAHARQLLDRLVQEFPASPQAFAARRRLALLDLEARIREQRGAQPRATRSTPPP